MCNPPNGSLYLCVISLSITGLILTAAQHYGKCHVILVYDTGATSKIAGILSAVTRKSTASSSNSSAAKGSAPTSQPGKAISMAHRALLTGRFTPDGDALLFEWPYSSIRARWQGSQIAIKLSSADKRWADQYQVLIDGKESTVLAMQKGTETYVLASGLTDSEHEVEVIKRTEAHVGTGKFSGFDVGPGKLLDPPAGKKRRLLVIGDSISAGFGVLCNSTDTPFTPGTESAYHAYPGIAARALDADLQDIAYSGKGIFRNMKRDAEGLTMAQLYDRVLPMSSKDLTYDMKTWIPHAVVINLATNDLSEQNGNFTEKHQTQFVAAYKGLLQSLRALFPEAPMYLTLGSMLSETWPTAEAKPLSRARKSMEATILSLPDDKKLRFLEYPYQDTYDVGRGCRGHPNERVHTEMAALLISSLKKELGW